VSAYKKFLILPVIILHGYCFPLPGATEPLPSGVKREASGEIDPNESSIAKITATLLERSHYSRKPFDDSVSEKFMDRYLEALDPLHFYFLQSDLQEFEKYRHSLDELTMKEGDTTPGHLIFDRLLERSQARVTYATNLLHSEKFDFTSNERYPLDRQHAPRPKDMNEAKEIWNRHLRHEYLQEKLNKKKPEEIVKTLSGRYHRLQKTLRELTRDEVFNIYLTALANVYDPHSDYLGKTQLENFAITMKLSLFGIGALLRSEDGLCQIEELVPGGPAEVSKKLKPKDKIMAVGQDEKEPVDVVDMPISKIVELIRGPKGTKVKLVVLPVGSDTSVRKNIVLVRDEISMLNSEAKARLIEFPTSNGKPERFGIIDLPSFYADFELDGKRKKDRKSTTTDVAKLLKKLNQEKISGLILDLRRNGGGSLEEAINLTGLFIEKGPVVQTKDPSGDVVVDSDADPTILYSGPLVVLTSRASASASEILAGALQDYGRALIVGDSSTHGKGTVQSLIRLEPIMEQARMRHTTEPGALKLTVRKFYRAGGASTQLKGVIPDIVLPSENNLAEVGESALDNPLPWDEVRSASFDKLNWVQPLLPKLRERNIKRVETDKDFDYVREDIDRFKKLLADKSISLNEGVRIAEKTEKDSRNLARRKERKARKEDGSKIYEITLKNADLPGLPAPVSVTNEVAGVTTPEKADPEDLSLDHESALDEKSIAYDIYLEESKKILSDLVELTAAQPHLAIKSAK